MKYSINLFGVIQRRKFRLGNQKSLYFLHMRFGCWRITTWIYFQRSHPPCHPTTHGCWHKEIRRNIFIPICIRICFTSWFPGKKSYPQLSFSASTCCLEGGWHGAPGMAHYYFIILNFPLNSCPAWPYTADSYWTWKREKFMEGWSGVERECVREVA